METATQALSSHQIAGQISAARDAIIGLEQEAHELSYPAVSGDQNAIASLATIRAQIRQTNEDIAVLQQAKDVAISKETAAQKAKDQAYRDRHFGVAKARAVEIVKFAARADELVSELKANIANISKIEGEIWTALREAGQPADGPFVGRRGLHVFAIDHLTSFTNGTDRFRQDRPVAEWARSAWAHLLPGEKARDE